MEEMIVRKEKGLQQFLNWFMFTACVLGVSMLTSYQPIFGNILLNVIPALLVLIYLDPVFFEKLKLSTLVIMRTLIVLAVLNVIPGQVYVNLVLIFLIINIMEATITDFKHKQYYNFVTGLILTGSVFLLKGYWEGGLYSAKADRTSATIAWIVAYTLWNWIFVTGEFSPAISLMHVGILLAPIVGSIITRNPGIWLLLRANTLTFGGILQISNKDEFEKSFKNDRFSNFIDFTHKKNVQISFMAVNLLLLAYTFAAIYI